ncbi:MAG: 3-keto-disaccharide hydrolase [Planctomycetota bacterium]|jgi:hypothetical protein
MPVPENLFNKTRSWNSLWTVIWTSACLLAASGCFSTGEPSILKAPPSKALILFDGTDFSHWTHVDGTPVQWEIIDNAMKVVPNTGSIMTKRKFQNFMLHVEFKVPELPPLPNGQSRGNRGNSGVYLQRRYEVQILDSFGVKSEDFDCGALYRFRVPDENVSRKPGEWQAFDIVFQAPRFEGEGEDLKKVKNARIWVRHNDVLVHDYVQLENKTGMGQPEGPEPGPILLQDHGNEVMFRNVWIVPKN